MKRNSRNKYKKVKSNKTKDEEKSIYRVFLKVWLLEFGIWTKDMEVWLFFVFYLKIPVFVGGHTFWQNQTYIYVYVFIHLYI